MEEAAVTAGLVAAAHSKQHRSRRSSLALPDAVVYQPQQQQQQQRQTAEAAGTPQGSSVQSSYARVHLPASVAKVVWAGAGKA